MCLLIYFNLKINTCITYLNINRISYAKKMNFKKADKTGERHKTVHSWGKYFHSRFRMLRLSSSSTAGLWLSLLRKNTKITFWTISFPFRCCWTFFPHKLFSVFLTLSTLSTPQPAPGCAHPAAQQPELQSKTWINLVLQHLKLHIGEKSPVARLKSRVRESCGEKKKAPER